MLLGFGTTTDEYRQEKVYEMSIFKPKPSLRIYLLTLVIVICNTFRGFHFLRRKMNTVCTWKIHTFLFETAKARVWITSLRYTSTINFNKPRVAFTSHFTIRQNANLEKYGFANDKFEKCNRNLKVVLWKVLDYIYFIRPLTAVLSALLSRGSTTLRRLVLTSGSVSPFATQTVLVYNSPITPILLR